jgi:hypothetical protein
VIGPKKLHTIRHELRDALAATGDDPIRWLEERMTAPERQGAAVSEGGEVLRSLRRFLEATDRGKRREQKTGRKK